VTESDKRAFGLAGTDIGGLRPKNIGARVKRHEDRRLLTGHGAFTDDRIVPSALHARSGAAITRMPLSPASAPPRPRRCRASLPFTPREILMIWLSRCSRRLG
jgi:hypothetical protein